jgi:hypothetical protein
MVLVASKRYRNPGVLFGGLIRRSNSRGWLPPETTSSRGHRGVESFDGSPPIQVAREILRGHPMGTPHPFIVAFTLSMCSAGAFGWAMLGTGNTRNYWRARRANAVMAEASSQHNRAIRRGRNRKSEPRPDRAPPHAVSHRDRGAKYRQASPPAPYWPCR